MYKKVTILLAALIVLGYGAAQDGEEVWWQEVFRDPTKIYNDVFILRDLAPGAVIGWAVGNDGLIMRLQCEASSKEVMVQEMATQKSEYAEYNFYSVSFGTPDTGWIVGAKKYTPGDPENFTGVILKVINGSAPDPNDVQFIDQTHNIYHPGVPPNTPFNEVCAVNKYVTWIVCGNGCVLRTLNGGQRWYRTASDPGTMSDCFLGIWAPDLLTAWVCGDNSGLVVKTTDGGSNWVSYYPENLISPSDTGLVYFDVFGEGSKRWFATSKGRVVYTENDGTSWSSAKPAPRHSWLKGVDNQRWSWSLPFVGTNGIVVWGPPPSSSMEKEDRLILFPHWGGNILSLPKLILFSLDYDLEAISSPSLEFGYPWAVGTDGIVLHRNWTNLGTDITNVRLTQWDETSILVEIWMNRPKYADSIIIARNYPKSGLHGPWQIRGIIVNPSSYESFVDEEAFWHELAEYRVWVASEVSEKLEDSYSAEITQ